MHRNFLTEMARPISNRPQDAILHYNTELVDVLEGHRIWAGSYDTTPNPLLALEMRILREQLGSVQGMRILDAGCGTGRWMRELSSRGARVFGIDACHEMIRRAPVPAALADVERIPVADDAFDVVICSFLLAYVPCGVIAELARVASRVIVSDLHPGTEWTRSFRAGGTVIHMRHQNHSIDALDDCARQSGLVRECRIEASFGEPERGIFEEAGKGNLFDQVRHVPAVLATIWRK